MCIFSLDPGVSLTVVNPGGFVNEKGRCMVKSKYHTVITSIEMTWIYLFNGWNNQKKTLNSEVLFIILCLIKR